MDAATIQARIACYRDGLLEDTLPFWIRHAIDLEQGGFITALDADGTIVDTDKGVWQQGRFTWLLGELYNNVEQRDEWLNLARHGAKFLEDHCTDSSDGRMWFQVTRDGRPLRKRRYAFSESFAAIACGELALATGDAKYAETAVDLFGRFLNHNLDPPKGASKYTVERPGQSLGFPMITIAAAQELRGTVQLPEANQWIDRSIRQIHEYHMNVEFQCVLEQVGPRGELLDHFDGRLLNPGHALEAAWFILREGKFRCDHELIKLGCQILDWMWAHGWDSEYGGILYFVDAKGLPVQEYWHDMKFWWPQNEAIIATLLAFQLTGDPKYAVWHQEIHDWAHQRFPDRQHGEWFGYLHRDGRRSNTLKGGLWKGPFHLPRMQLECWKILEEISKQPPPSAPSA